MQGVARPLSPHLQIWRWRISMWLSSLHRITGLLLSIGALALAVWLIALASGPAAYERVHEVYAAGWFKALLVLWAFSFFLHLLNGVRHLVWDTGAGFEPQTIRASSWTVLVVALVLTAAYAAFAFS